MSNKRNAPHKRKARQVRKARAALNERNRARNSSGDKGSEYPAMNLLK